MDAYPYAKNQHYNSIQSEHTVKIYYRILLFACPGERDHKHMNGLNQIYIFMFA